MVLARGAQESLGVQYYIWHGDDSGRLLLKELLDAADRGVRVRLLLDDLGVGAADDDVFHWIDAHPQVSVVLFNPIALRGARTAGLLSDPRRLNRRMHNKSMTADNTVTVVGGLEQHELQQHPGLRRIELHRGDRAHLVVVGFDIPTDDAAVDAG